MIIAWFTILNLLIVKKLYCELFLPTVLNEGHEAFRADAI
jgi:hypothetical protein